MLPIIMIVIVCMFGVVCVIYISEHLTACYNCIFSRD